MSILRKKIIEILMKSWDPIGVSELEGAENEYDRYVEEIILKLKNGEIMSEMSLSNYLYYIEKNIIELECEKVNRDIASLEIMKIFHRTFVRDKK
jgi:hypothetical protein